MRRLTDVTIRTGDRPAPPRPDGGRRTAARPARPERAAAPARPARRWVPPFWWKRARPAIIGAALCLFVGVPAIWLVRSGIASHAVAALRDDAIGMSAQAGFRVDDIFVEGRHRTVARDLLAALKVRRGDPILGIDLAAASERLSAIPWVKSVAIERQLPNALRIFITEREPIALWQSQGRYYLIDRDGLVIGDDIAEFANLPLLVGESAPDHVGALLDMLNSEPDLAKRVKASQWISERRWNLEIDDSPGGIEVRLPEDNPAAAWHELAQLEREQKLLERKVTMIDMRLPDRLVLRVPGGVEPPPSATARVPGAGRHKAAPGREA